MNKLIREKAPLILNITNNVTVNDIANVLTMVGASPMMTNAIDEIEDLLTIVQKCDGVLVVNIGTLDRNQAQLITKAVALANRMNVPVIVDPVGAGASKFRTEFAKQLLATSKIALVRGNYNEISALLGFDIDAHGVDSISGSDQTIALQFAQKYNTVVLISGLVDYLSDGIVVECITGGSAYLPQISGTGCMLTALCGAYLAVVNNPLTAAKLALQHVLLASERAEQDGKSIMQFKQQWFKHMELITYE